ncbi:MAG: alanine racemase [Treponema sp.]|nr:alanine racemase [Treponema sp.]
MRTSVFIHLDRFLRNFNAVKARIGKEKRVCVPVKADGYGHGALQIAKISEEAGAFCLGVATVDEGIELRKGGINIPILLMSQPDPQEIPEIFKASLTPFVSDSWFVNALNEQAVLLKTRLPVHLKIDTGMCRTGCRAEEAAALAGQITKCTFLELTGTATHLAAADSTDLKDIACTRTQLTCFRDAVNAIRTAGIDPGIVHAANSGAVILHPDSWFDMVRPGILLYGYKAAQENENSNFPYEPLTVEPVMELKSTVVMIKKIKKGESVSYGRIWTAEEDTNIAILPAGYADGLPRIVSGKWQAIIGGNAYPLVGRICMDQCFVNLGINTTVRRWDEAEIFGSSHDASALAEAANTIPYEITCNISKRVPRIYMNK